MRRIEKLIPPGGRTSELTGFTVLAILLAVIVSGLLFANELELAVDALYKDTYPAHIELRPGAVMPPFWEIMGDKCVIFHICALCMLGFVIANYSYFYSESKSIYTMRRIPNRWELHYRCWAMPMLGALCILVVQWLFTLLCYIIYIRSIPEGVLL